MDAERLRSIRRDEALHERIDELERRVEELEILDIDEKIRRKLVELGVIEGCAEDR